jgi:hypothetical protein
MPRGDLRVGFARSSDERRAWAVGKTGLPFTGRARAGDDDGAAAMFVPLENPVGKSDAEGQLATRSMMQVSTIG